MRRWRPVLRGQGRLPGPTCLTEPGLRGGTRRPSGCSHKSASSPSLLPPASHPELSCSVADMPPAKKRTVSSPGEPAPSNSQATASCTTAAAAIPCTEASQLQSHARAARAARLACGAAAWVRGAAAWVRRVAGWARGAAAWVRRVAGWARGAAGWAPGAAAWARRVAGWARGASGWVRRVAGWARGAAAWVRRVAGWALRVAG